MKPSSNTVGLLKSHKHEKVAYEVRLIKQVTNRKLGLYWSFFDAEFPDVVALN